MRPKGSSHQIWILGGPDGEDPRSLPFAGADDAMATRYGHAMATLWPRYDKYSYF